MIFMWDFVFCCCLEMDSSLFHVGSPADFLENQFAEYWQRAMVQGIGHRTPLERSVHCKQFSIFVFPKRFSQALLLISSKYFQPELYCNVLSGIMIFCRGAQLAA
jgi:hypothetical protein